MPQKKQKTPKDFWIEFCSSTGVRGFSYITKSICVAEEWFWGVMIIICGALTVYDISINVSKYLSYPTSTKVVVFNNDTISLGSPTICIDIDIESLDYSGIDLTKPETVRQFLSQFRNENIEDLLLYEFYKMRNRSALSLSEQSRLLYASDFPINWGDLKLDSRLSPLVSLTTAMIGAVVRHENLIRGDYGPEDYNWGIVKFDRDSEFFYVDQANSAAIYEVYKFYMKRNSHLKTLHRLSGALLCQMVDLNLVVHLRNETNGLLKSLAYTPCDPKKISWLGTPPYSDISREVVCVRLVNDVAFTFKTPEERTVISLNQAAIFHRPNYFAEAIRIDFSEDPSVTHKAQNLLWVMFGNNSEVTVSLLGHYKQLQSGRNPCNPTSHTQCKMSCRAKYIAQNCQCKSLSLLEFAPPEAAGLPVCGELTSADLTEWERTENYMLIPHLGSASENCSQITKTYRPFPECSKVCTRNCEYKIYGYSVNNAPINEANKTTVILLADPFVYPFYEEYLLIEARQFLGTLGGNLSFWFGASFLVLLHVLVFLIRIPIELVKNRPHKSTVISTGNLTTPNQVNKENVELKQTKTEPPINSEKSSIQLIGSGNK